MWNYLNKRTFYNKKPTAAFIVQWLIQLELKLKWQPQFKCTFTQICSWHRFYFSVLENLINIIEERERYVTFVNKERYFHLS